MIDTVSNASTFSVLWQYVGPLIGVGFGYLISHKVWNRQRQWEMKRDVVFDMVRALGEFDNALFNLSHIYSLAIPESEDLRNDTLGKRCKARERFDSCTDKFARTSFLTDFVVGRELSTALFECNKQILSVAVNVMNGDAGCFRHSQSEITKRVKAVYLSARKELKLEHAG